MEIERVKQRLANFGTRIIPVVAGIAFVLVAVHGPERAADWVSQELERYDPDNPDNRSADQDQIDDALVSYGFTPSRFPPSRHNIRDRSPDGGNELREFTVVQTGISNGCDILIALERGPDGSFRIVGVLSDWVKPREVLADGIVTENEVSGYIPAGACGGQLNIATATGSEAISQE